MSKINSALKNNKAFVPFITCGDPDFETTQKIIESAVNNGAGMIVLGIPFSDPTAEGPVIQKSNIRALEAGVTTDKIFDFIENIRKSIKVPFVFKTYANVVFSYDADKFISKCSEIGVDALIVPDLPFEEKNEFLPMCKKYSVDLVSIIVPSCEERIKMISGDADGFIYIMSPKESIYDISRIVKKYTDLPCIASFESVTSQEAERIYQSVDGIMIDLDVVKIIEEHKTNSAEYVGNYVKRIKIS